jgi:hypothetical protein
MANPNPVARFQPGNQFGGRTKGARARLSDKFFDALAADFNERADVVIAAVRENDPAIYLNIVARLMPKELEARLQVEQRLPGNLDPQSWATLHRVIDLIEQFGPAGADPLDVFETIERALVQAYAAAPLAIEHKPPLLAPLVTPSPAEPVLIEIATLPPPPF